MIDCSVSIGAAVLVFTDSNSSENVDYEGRFCCVAALQQVRVFLRRKHSPHLENSFVRHGDGSVDNVGVW